MMIRVTSYPPLGFPTVVPGEQTRVQFTVAIEAGTGNEEWDVQLWHNFEDGSQWQALNLQQANDAVFRVPSAKGSEDTSAKFFTGTLIGRPASARPVSFTIRFCAPSDEKWKWARDESGTEDGELLYQPPIGMLKDERDLSQYIDGLGESLSIKNVLSETPETTLWSITATAEPAHGEQSKQTVHKLGMPSNTSCWFALIRLWRPWLAPRHGRNLSLTPEDAVLYSFLRQDGLAVVALAVSGIDDVLTVFSYENDNIRITAQNDREHDGVARVLVAVGGSFEFALCAVMSEAERLVRNNKELHLQRIRGTPPTLVPDQSWVQGWYDGFSYCTWNGLGQNLNEEKILGALKSLKDNGIKVANLIIDDNWQSLDNPGKNQHERGWMDFEANPEAFPNGLKGATAAIRENFPNVKRIAVWHALLGYWGAISPIGSIAKNYKTTRVERREGSVQTVVDAPDVKRLYNDFYDFLLSSGINSVKTDAQYALDQFVTAPARRSLTSTYLDAWMEAQINHFSSDVISCMSLTPPIIFSQQLPRHLPPVVLRNSDDFFPDVEESHPWHVFCNAHNALLTRHLNVMPDWDMFQTHHHWSGFHAAARCVSGGPIYVTDEPGKHDVGLVRQMTAETIDGQTVILRPNCVARSVETYVGYNEKRLHKIGTFDGDWKPESSFLAIFNCHSIDLAEVIPFSDFVNSNPVGMFVVNVHRAEKVFAAEAPSLFVKVAGHEWEFLTATRAEGPFELSDEHPRVSIANLGLLEQMTGAAAIQSTSVTLQRAEAEDSTVDVPKSSNLSIVTWLKALGRLGLWISDLGNLNFQRQVSILIDGNPMPSEFAWKSGERDCVLELDTAAGWKSMALQPARSNVYKVEVLIQA